MFEAAGGMKGVRRLADAWHARVMEMDRRAIACFDQALADGGLADDPRLRQVLQDYFAWATTTSMARYHATADEVLSGLPIPRWSWNGLVG